MRTFIRGVGAAALLCSAFTVTVAAQAGPGADPEAGEVGVPLPAKVSSLTVTPKVASFIQNFDDVTLLAGSGWTLINNSAPLGITGWFQGPAPADGGPFDAHQGAPDAYIGANNNNRAGAGGIISNWLITPLLDFGDNAQLIFWTRKPAVPAGGADYPDRLQVRLSTNGASANVGAPGDNVGDFTDVLLEINPALVVGGYPYVWTRYTITNADGIPASGTGRIAFRYFVTAAGSSGSNADYIGIDTVSFSTGLSEYRIGGTVAGLSGTGLTLTLNGGTPLPIGANGSFQFPDSLSTGSSYTVTATHPTNPSQTCTVDNGTGTVGNSDVTDVQVTCVTHTFAVGGTVSGLRGSSLVLQNNGGDDRTVLADGAFTMPTEVNDLGIYDITVRTQPETPNQACTVANGSGTVANADVTSVKVSCVTNTYTIGGTVTGLDGDRVELQLNGGATINVTTDGAFTIGTLTDGESYAVTVRTNPASPAQTCTVARGNGTLVGADVTDIEVSCVTNPFTLTVVSGGGQSANLGTLFAEPLVVELTNGEGAAVPDADVTFEAPESGASVVFETGSERGSLLTVSTDVDGRATVMATANDRAGCVPVFVSAALADTAGLELTNVNPLPEIHQDGFEALPGFAKGLLLCQP